MRTVPRDAETHEDYPFAARAHASRPERRVDDRRLALELSRIEAEDAAAPRAASTTLQAAAPSILAQRHRSGRRRRDRARAKERARARRARCARSRSVVAAFIDIVPIAVARTQAASSRDGPATGTRRRAAPRARNAAARARRLGAAASPASQRARHSAPQMSAAAASQRRDTAAIIPPRGDAAAAPRTRRPSGPHAAATMRPAGYAAAPTGALAFGRARARACRRRLFGEGLAHAHALELAARHSNPTRSSASSTAGPGERRVLREAGDARARTWRDGGLKIHAPLMRDALHPTAEGLQRWRAVGPP